MPRGITVCPEWQIYKVYEAWCLSTFEVGKTIDRIDNDKSYSPENCCWATNSEQQRNSRHDTPKRKERTLKRIAGIVAYTASIYGDVATRTEKMCPSCNTKKPCSEFGANKSSADGLGSYCKLCKRQYENARNVGRRKSNENL